LKLKILASVQEAKKHVGKSGPNNILCMDSHIAFDNVPHKRCLREMKHEMDAAGLNIKLAEKEKQQIGVNECSHREGL